MDGNKQQVDDFLAQIEADVTAEFGSEDDDDLNESVGVVFQKLKKKHIRHSIIEKKVRPDGRKTDEIRDINIDIDLLPACMDQVYLPVVKLRV